MRKMDILHIWATDVIFLYKIVHAFKKPAVLFEGFNLDVGHSLCLSQWAGDYVRDPPLPPHGHIWDVVLV